ncbi:MAG: FAD-binding oxidoreductase [Rhodospirillales bacterium]
MSSDAAVIQLGPERDIPLAAEVREALIGIVGAAGWIEDASRLAPFLIDERKRYRGRCAGVVRPATTAEVAAVVRVCAHHRIPISIQGGNTGLVGGGAPAGGIVLWTGRLNRVRAVDALNRTITVEAGVILADVQAAAEAADALFPLSLAAEGSCHIGGNLATNAGGVAVLRYGNARDLVLGLEVVLADGRVWDGLRGLRKDNTGYDLKQLFLGAEGTLGIITAAVLKLFPRPRVTETVLAGVKDPEAAVELFHRVGAGLGDSLSAFELIPRIAVDFCLRHVSGTVDPFRSPYPFYVLMSLTSPRPGEPLRAAVEEVLAQALEAGIVADATIAMTTAQADALWRLRETIPEAQKPEGASIKNDVSVPVSRVAAFIARATAACAAALPGIRPVPFGHIGDGNVHFNLSQPVGMDPAAYLALWDEMEHLVSDIAWELGGSFSAEHGIGRLKRRALRRYKSEVELSVMRALKRILDPLDILNPGKVVDPD